MRILRLRGHLPQNLTFEPCFSCVLVLQCVSNNEESKCGRSPDLERCEFFAIQQLVDYLPNGKFIKREVKNL